MAAAPGIKIKIVKCERMWLCCCSSCNILNMPHTASTTASRKPQRGADADGLQGGSSNTHATALLAALT
jgi:hypothetical protein